MKKICPCCSEIYRGEEPIEYCPKVKCDCDTGIVKIDDLLVDLIVKFWALDVQTISCCAGHLYEDVFSPYIRFFAHQFEEHELAEVSEVNLFILNEAYDLFAGLNENDNFDIGKIEFNDTDYGYQFTVRPLTVPTEIYLNSKQKVAIQAEFLTLLYGAIDEIQIIQDSNK